MLEGSVEFDEMLENDSKEQLYPILWCIQTEDLWLLATRSRLFYINIA